jgi:tagatose-1,6-bisphosphate aldolase
MTISLGKWRALQQCSTSSGAFAVLALDHRGNLRAALNPDSPDSVTDEVLSAFKVEVIRHLSGAASAVLLDPEFGAAPCITSGALPGSVGLMLAVEATGYTGDPTARVSRILPGWSIAKAKRVGASGVKLLVYYHPEAPTARDIENLVQQVGKDCHANELPLYLEPLSYSPDPARKKLTPAERRQVVLESARTLTPLGVDILKAEFPLDINAETDEREWERACAELSQASRAPWVLLSASVDYDTFLKQVTAACRAGASGVAVGRAVWQEATTLSGDERLRFLREVGLPRMQRVTALCNALARPWSDIYTPPALDYGWYANY